MMNNNVSIQINEINRLMNYDRSKTLLEQSSADFMVDRMSMNKAGVNYKDYKDANSVDINKLASLLCGDDSPFSGWFEIPWIEYKSEELFCDLLAGILMAFGPFGAVAGLSVELLHAKDLWNKGDKFGAILSITIGLLPIFGDIGAKGIRVLARKIGKSGIVEVAKVINLIIKFMSGEVKASKVLSSIKNLSKDERKILHWFWSTSYEILDKTSKLSTELSKVRSNLDTSGYIGQFVDESLEKIITILEESSLLKSLGDLAAQFGSIMTFIIGAEMIKSLGFDENDNSFETMEEILEYYNNNPDAWLNIDTSIPKEIETTSGIPNGPGRPLKSN